MRSSLSRTRRTCSGTCKFPLAARAMINARAEAVSARQTDLAERHGDRSDDRPTACKTNCDGGVYPASFSVTRYSSCRISPSGIVTETGYAQNG
jgi:hypothetical protein